MEVLVDVVPRDEPREEGAAPREAEDDVDILVVVEEDVTQEVGIDIGNHL